MQSPLNIPNSPEVHEPISAKLQRLSTREKQCLELYLAGHTAKETSKILNLSHRTVEDYITNLKFKLGCKYKRQIIALFTSNLQHTHFFDEK